MVAVKYEDLSEAFDFVSFARPMEHRAYLSIDTGNIYWVSELDSPDDEVPEDLARPVLFVSDVETALRFYIDQLGFTKKWHVDNVCQVDRGGCEIILCEDRTRHDKSRLFVELTRDGIDELRREIVERAVATDKTWWGYDTIRIVDQDGNELFFPLDETNDRERQPGTGAAL